MHKPYRFRVFFAAVVIALSSFAAFSQPGQIAIGPYVQNVGKDSATICWSTLAGQVDCSSAAPGAAQSVRTYDHHAVTLRGLLAGTTYTYDVLRDGSDAGKATFTTFPEGEQPFNFVVLSDCHSQTCEAIVRRAMADKPDLVFCPGDSASDGLQTTSWEGFFRVNQEFMRNAPYFMVLGNHELDSPLYFDFFALPGNQRYYSFDRGPVHFVVLDSFGPRMRDIYWGPGRLATNQPVTQNQMQQFEEQKERYWQQQLTWLRDDLGSNQGAKYIFVFFHHPLYTSWSRTLDAAKERRARYGTIFQDYGVSVVFNGHDHHYNHALVGGVHFIMTDAGGEPLGADAPQPETIKCWKPHNYARVDVGPERAHVRAVDIDGKLIEEFDIMPRAVP